MKAFAESFDVTAAAPVAVAAAPGGARRSPEAAEEQSEFDVISRLPVTRRSASSRSLQIVSGLGLEEAKDLVGGAPKPLLEKVTKDAAEEAKTKLEAAGATDTVK